MKRDYKKLLESGNKAQIEKLMENRHKKGFKSLNLFYVRKRIVMESEELFAELFGVNPQTNSIDMKGILDYKAIRRELADIANFCHMGILTCDEEIKKGK